MNSDDIEVEALERAAGVRALPERAVLRVLGEDARTWLQGQVTQDTRGLAPGGSVYGLVLSLKGRILTDVHVIDRGARGMAMIVARRDLDALVARLDHHVIMEDVAIEVDDACRVLTVQGPRAADVAAAANLGDAGEVFEVDRLGHGGRDVLVDAAHADTVLDALARAARTLGGAQVDDAAWERARVRAGVPAIFSDFGEATYPQEAGLTARAVSFQKGCYLGQEVVCMLENRGQLSRRLVRLEADAALAVGAPLEGLDGASLGEITSAVRDAGRGLGLGFVKRAHAAPGTAVRAGGVEARVVGPVGG